MVKRKTKNQGGLSVERAREIVVRVKKMEGLSEHTISNYNKLFNDLERCFAKINIWRIFQSVTQEGFLKRILLWQLKI
jgi:integrase/recombinase XerD